MKLAILVLVFAAQSMRLSTCPCDGWMTGSCTKSAPQPPAGWCEPAGAPSDPCSCPHVESSEEGVPPASDAPTGEATAFADAPAATPRPAVPSLCAVGGSPPRASPPLQSRLCTFLL